MALARFAFWVGYLRLLDPKKFINQMGAPSTWRLTRWSTTSVLGFFPFTYFLAYRTYWYVLIKFCYSQGGDWNQKGQILRISQTQALCWHIVHGLHIWATTASVTILRNVHRISSTQIEHFWNNCLCMSNKFGWSCLWKVQYSTCCQHHYLV